MVTKIPNRDAVCSDPTMYRFRKRQIRSVGKQVSFELLEPEIRALTSKIRNRQLDTSGPPDALRPTERRRILLRALDELARSRKLSHANDIAARSAEFLTGMTGVGARVLLAGVLLAEAMLAAKGFERKVLGGLTILNSIDENIVQRFCAAVESRADHIRSPARDV